MEKLTGRVRYRVVERAAPGAYLLALQVEYTERRTNYPGGDVDVVDWRDARVEDFELNLPFPGASMMGLFAHG